MLQGLWMLAGSRRAERGVSVRQDDSLVQPCDSAGWTVRELPYLGTARRAPMWASADGWGGRGVHVQELPRRDYVSGCDSVAGCCRLAAWHPRGRPHPSHTVRGRGLVAGDSTFTASITHGTTRHLLC